MSQMFIWCLFFSWWSTKNRKGYTVAAHRMFISGDRFAWGGVIKWLICHFTSRLLLGTIQAWGTKPHSQSCLCVSLYRQVVLSLELLFYHLAYNIKVHVPRIQAALFCFVFFSLCLPHISTCTRSLNAKLLQIRSCNPLESLAASATCHRWHSHPRAWTDLLM